MFNNIMFFCFTSLLATSSISNDGKFEEKPDSLGVNLTHEEQLFVSDENRDSNQWGMFDGEQEVLAFDLTSEDGNETPIVEEESFVSNEEGQFDIIKEDLVFNLQEDEIKTV